MAVAVDGTDEALSITLGGSGPVYGYSIQDSVVRPGSQGGDEIKAGTMEVRSL